MRALARGMLTALLLGAGSAEARPDWSRLIVCDGPSAGADRAALAVALRLLPRLPSRVAVIDADAARPEVRPTLLRLDAFITRGSPVIYIVRQSALLRGAVAGSSMHTHALAAVVWHEMAHVDGADEREARRQEQSLWMAFLRDQRLDALAALRYLAALERRPYDAALALR